MGDGRVKDKVDPKAVDNPKKDATEKLRDDAYDRGDKKAEGDKAEKTADKPASNETETQRIHRLQDTLSKLSTVLSDDTAAGLKKEIEQGIYGPNTKKALEEATKWLKSNVADTLVSLD